jgi:succinate dehydrogenase/fumarate reductase flavoprotein subunit
MEMVLFYPTVIVYPPFLYGLELPHGLLLEQVQGKLLNANMQEFIPEQIPTRDIMVSLIYRELAEGRGTPHGGVFLDVSKSPFSGAALKKRLKTYLPEKYAHLLKYGIDLARQPLEVAPMAHFTIGGIKINADCEATVAGLYAAGEVEGNIHGANRLAGNALPETQVFGAVAGQGAARWAQGHDLIPWDIEDVESEIRRIEAVLQPRKNFLSPSRCTAKLQETMWKYLGVNRDAAGIEKAIGELERMQREDLPQLAAPAVRKFNLAWLEAIEFSHMLELSQVVARSALMRTETRGHHFRLDYPQSDDQNWSRHILAGRKGDGIRLWTEPANGI